MLWLSPLSPPSSPSHLLFQVQDFGLKHLLGMGSLRLLSLAGETLTLYQGPETPRGWGGTGHGDRESPGDTLGTASTPPGQQAAAPSPACQERSALGSWDAVFFGVMVFWELCFCHSSVLGCWFLRSCSWGHSILGLFCWVFF